MLSRITTVYRYKSFRRNFTDSFLPTLPFFCSYTHRVVAPSETVQKESRSSVSSQSFWFRTCYVNRSRQITCVCLETLCLPLLCNRVCVHLTETSDWCVTGHFVQRCFFIYGWCEGKEWCHVKQSLTIVFLLVLRNTNL